MINKVLLELLVCPKSKAPLKQAGDKLICEVSGLVYPIINNTPVLLIDCAHNKCQK